PRSFDPRLFVRARGLETPRPRIGGALRRAVADQAGVAPGAKRQRKRIEKNRFPGAGLAGQNGKATVEFEIKLVDQNDVADGQLNEHGVEGLPDAPPYGAAL